eukprot:NODE_2592_length_1384_cov_138.449643_g2464_i0.p1 GENE.NODE_2592_length_1384_cov_138.449643_g2464_i0~~NODE_2592_length_1384_cov_138.449643_g2464_i0.p1  ORF type:complete len:390 (-),score=99.64 NODE_2592_length_1384_cov_138.449643_g2464_i0:213-1331(-)
MSEQSKKPADTPFKQQRLPAWQPILSPPWVICCFFLVAAVFIPIGALVIAASGKVVEYESEYPADPADTSCTVANGVSECWVEITVDKEMEAPVYMYYKLENFYQNHRRYAKSRSDTQLAGNDVSSSDIDDCEPFRWVGDKQGKSGFERYLYAPCGLIAWSMFNDSFAVYKAPTADFSCKANPGMCTLLCDGQLQALEASVNGPGCTTCTCEKNGIAWKSDRDKKFKTPHNTVEWNHSAPGIPSYYYDEGPTTANPESGHAIPVQNDEDFMVWMRTASLPTFRKLYRKFNSTNFAAGDKLWIRVKNRFRVSDFGGKKFVILSTTTWIGGKNYFLGTAYVIVGCLCFVLALIFVIKHLLGGKAQSEIPNFPKP